MKVIVIRKRIWIGILLCAAVLAIGLIVYFSTRDGEKAPAEPTMAVIDAYELNAIPVMSRLVPVYRVSTADKAIALTIDAAWNADKTKQILDILDRYQIKATFFLCGVWVAAYPELVQEIAARGHEIGNHSMTHPHMNRLSAEEIRTELSSLDDEIERRAEQLCTAAGQPFDLVVERA